MRNEAGEAVSLRDELELFLPQLDRMVFEDLKERVVLRGRQRQLDHFARKKWKHGAAAAALSLEVPHIGNRHVVRKIERLQPFEIAIQGSRTEAGCAEAPPVHVDAPGPPDELVAIHEQPTVVIQIVDIYLASTPADGVEKSLRHLVTTLGHDLKRRSDTERLVDIDQPLAEVPSSLGLDVMRHNDG